MYSPLFASEIFTEFVPVVCADAVHCISSTKGTFSSIYGSDSNRRQVFLSLMLVSYNESEVTWNYFLWFTKSALQSEWT